MKRIVYILWIVLSSCFAYAQKLNGTLDRNPVTIGVPFQLTYSLDAQGSGFKGPNLNDFDVLSGPNPMSMQQNINGVQSFNLSFTYYLSAKKEGKFSIGTAGINSGGKKIESNA